MYTSIPPPFFLSTFLIFKWPNLSIYRNLQRKKNIRVNILKSNWVYFQLLDQLVKSLGHKHENKMHFTQTKIQICCKISMDFAVIVPQKEKKRKSKCYHQIHALMLTKHSTAPSCLSGVHCPPLNLLLSPFSSTYPASPPFRAVTRLRLKHLSSALSQEGPGGGAAGQAGHLGVPQLRVGLMKGEGHLHGSWSRSVLCSEARASHR